MVGLQLLCAGARAHAQAAGGHRRHHPGARRRTLTAPAPIRWPWRAISSRRRRSRGAGSGVSKPRGSEPLAGSTPGPSSAQPGSAKGCRPIAVLPSTPPAAASSAHDVPPTRSITGFVRGLGLFDSTMIVVGSMIGSGIFIVSADIARQTGSAGGLLLAWIITGVLTVAAALSYGELAAMMPQAGGQYVYLRESYSPLWGFLYGWTLFLVIQTGTIAAVAVAFARLSRRAGAGGFAQRLDHFADSPFRQNTR